MIRITIIKKTASKETLRLTSIEELTEQIRQGKYAEQVQRLRTYYPLLNVQRNSDGEMGGVDEYTKTLPRILFALEQENRQGQRTTLSYTGLVLLEVNNLTGRLEAEAIRQGAAEIPHTLMAFVGADGQSVKIVCLPLTPSRERKDRAATHCPSDCRPIPREPLRARTPHRRSAPSFLVPNTNSKVKGRPMACSIR